MRWALVMGAWWLAACSVPPQPAPDTMVTPQAVSAPAPQPPPMPRVTIVLETEAGALSVSAELAATPEQRARGLMYRESLPEGEGMFFVAEKRRVQSFWMKNTRIPLDMIFIDGPPDTPRASVIGIVHRAEPETLTPRSAGGPGRYVLEVPGGWASKHGVKVGNQVRWSGLPGEGSDAL